METGNKLAIATVHDRSVGKESACNVRDQGWIPGSRRSPREGNGNPLQYSRLENTMDRGAWEPTRAWGCKESDTTERLKHTHSYFLLQEVNGNKSLFLP